MTKVMFQVGLLSFFVSAIVFGTHGMPLMDMVLRSFIVFIAVVMMQAIIFVMVGSMKRPAKGHGHEMHSSDHASAPPAADQNGQAHQTATPT
jgi:hypothetical protein